MTTNAIAYHAHSQLHQDNAEIVDREQQFHKEAIRIQHTANFNQDEGLQLGLIWNDIIIALALFVLCCLLYLIA